MILSGRKLVNRVKDDNIFENSPDWHCFTGWQFDLKLGKQAFISDMNKPIVLEKNEYLVIEPGTFALLETEEKINMPHDLMGFIAVKFSFKKLGLINISGFHVDPGYKGKLIFSVYNAGPNDILMQRNRPVFMIFFAKLTNATDEFIEQLECHSADPLLNDPPLNGLSLDDGEIEIIKSNKDKITRNGGFPGIPIDMMTAIQGKSVSLSGNTSRIEKLENSFKIYGSIAVVIIGALITILFALLQRVS